MTSKDTLHEEWKRSILELPDEHFFSLMRLYLGDIKTPFHKPRLVEKLAALLSDSEMADRIIALTDVYDAEVLTAVEVLHNPDPALLFRLFQGERDYFNFHNHLMNLHERLLIFTAPDSSELYLNPYLYPLLKERVLTPRLLFPPADETADEEDPLLRQPISISEEHIWSVVSFLHHYGIHIKANGTIRKSTAEQLRNVFSGLCSGDDDTEMYRLLRALLNMGLLQLRGGRLHLLEDGVTRMLSMERPRRMACLWSAIALDGSAGDRISVPSADWERIESLADLLLRFFSRIPPQTFFPLQSIRRLLFTVHLLDGESKNTGTEFNRSADRIIAALTDLRVFSARGTMMMLNPVLQAGLHPRENQHPLLLHPDFSVTVQPPLNFSDGLAIAACMKIISHAAYPQFEFSSDSYIHGRLYFSAQQLRKTVSALSSAGIPQNITFSMDAWEQNYSSVKMTEGITLILAKHWDRLVRHNPEFQIHILNDLGHGIYVMDPEYQTVWRDLLKGMGISPLPPVQKGNRQSSTDIFSRIPAPAGHTESTDRQPVDLRSEYPRPNQDTGKAEEVRNELIEALENIDASSGKHKELSTRIEKKLILYPSQLENPVYTESGSEARGIDYAGKVRIIQQALQSGSSLLELIERTARGNPARHLLRPTELEKSGKELVLVGEELPAEKSIRIRVEKIGYIKKWKGSLFIRPRDYKNP